MKIKKIIIFIIISLNVTINILAQSNFMPGYVVTFENDTIEGFVEKNNESRMYSQCTFKQKGNINKYSTHQIKAYAFSDGTSYISQILDSSFVEALVIGAMSLYKYGNSFIVQKDDQKHILTYSKKEEIVDGRPMLKEDNMWRNILNYLSSDCVSNQKSLATVSFNEKKLTKFIVQYNKCMNTEYIEYKNNQPWTKIYYGFLIGVNSNHLKMENLTSSGTLVKDTYFSFNAAFGLSINATSPRISDRISFSAELHYFKASYSAILENNGYHESIINLTTLTLPLSLKYSLPVRKNFICFQGGLSFDHHLKSNNLLLSESIVGNNIYIQPEREIFTTNNFQSSVWTGISWQKPFKNFKSELALRYFLFSNLSNTFDIQVNNNRYSFVLIISR